MSQQDKEWWTKKNHKKKINLRCGCFGVYVLALLFILSVFCMFRHIYRGTDADLIDFHSANHNSKFKKNVCFFREWHKYRMSVRENVNQIFYKTEISIAHQILFSISYYISLISASSEVFFVKIPIFQTLSICLSVK